MINLLSPNEVTVIRRKDDNYRIHQIYTIPLLAGGASDAARVRANVIERLRKDPSVVLVLEGRDGKCEETAELQDGFSIAVNLYEDPGRESTVTIHHNGKTVFSETYTVDEEFGLFVNSDAKEVTSEIIDLLGLIADKDYSLFENLDPELAAEMDADDEEVDRGFTLFDAKKALNRGGYETESVCTGEAITPFLFVHENEVLLLGSKHFSYGSLFYLDMKRVPVNLEPDAAGRLLGDFRKAIQGIKVIEWEDGSWSFRVDLGWSIDEEDFLARLDAGIRKLGAVADWFLGQRDILYDFNGPQEKRHLFIHEVIAEYTKLKNLKY